jgi:cytochrome c oxidase subunit 2
MKFYLQLGAVLVLGALLSYAALTWFGSRENTGEVPIQTPSEQAAQLAEVRGCQACHTLDGSAGIGPTWLGSWGATRVLKDGSRVIVDENYLRLAMQNPQAQVVEGYEPLMLPANFTEEEMSLVINLIRDISLGGAE